MVPAGSLWTRASVDARADQSGFTGPWWATSEAICAA
jgi:hypothetical protein